MAETQLAPSPVQTQEPTGVEGVEVRDKYLPAGITEEESPAHPEETTEEIPQEEEKKVAGEEAALEKIEAVPKTDDKELPSDSAIAPPMAAAPSFKEESYRVGDLKDAEKKALNDLKLKIEESIKMGAFTKRPKSRELEVVKPIKESAEKTEGEADVKDEDQAEEIEPEAKKTILTDEASTATESAAVTEPHVAEEPAVVVKEEVRQEPAPTEALALPEEAKEVPEEATTSVIQGEVPAAADPVKLDTSGTYSETCAEAAGEEFTVEKTTTREVVIEEKEVPTEDFHLWGVPLLHSKGDERTDVILLKFLRARDFKVNDALSMLKNAVIWRKEFSADKLLEEEFGSDFDSVAYMYGCDKEGHPVCYNHYGVFQNKELYHKIIEDEGKLNNFLRWRIQVLEKGITKLDFNPGGIHSMMQITDLKDSPGFWKWRNITKKALTVLQDNYPELVAKQVFINVPWYFGLLYSRYGRIITQRQKSKVVVARPGKVTETLFKYISPEHVPIRYGGLSRPNDMEFEGVDAPVKEITIKAGGKQILEIPVTDSGATAVWDVAVIGWDVVYGEEFVPSAEDGYTVIIQKSKKVGALEEPARNSFTVTEPGKVVLTIDNSASRRRRSVFHRYIIKKP